MKKFFSILLIASLVLAFVGCTSPQNKDAAPSGKASSTTAIDPAKALAILESWNGDYAKDADFLTRVSDIIAAYSADVWEKWQQNANRSCKPWPLGAPIPKLPLAADAVTITREEPYPDTKTFKADLPLNEIYTMQTVVNTYENGNPPYVNVDFIVNQTKIVKNDPQFAEAKKALDSLIPDGLDLFRIALGTNAATDDSLWEPEGEAMKATNRGDLSYYTPVLGYIYWDNDKATTVEKFKSIDEIKAAINKIYTKSAAEEIFSYAFTGYKNNDSSTLPPIYIMQDGKLCINMLRGDMGGGTNYSTDQIIAVDEKDDTLTVDLMADYGMGDGLVYERIVLQKEDGAWKLTKNLH